MRINPEIAAQAIKRYEQVVVKETTQTSGFSTQDRVELSDRAQAYVELTQAARLSEPVNEEKVHAIINRMASGQYQVNTQDLARKILDLTL